MLSWNRMWWCLDSQVCNNSRLGCWYPTFPWRPQGTAGSPASHCGTLTTAFSRRPGVHCQNGCPRTTWRRQNWHNFHIRQIWELNSRWICPWVSLDKSDLLRDSQETGSDFLLWGKSRKKVIRRCNPKPLWDTLIIFTLQLMLTLPQHVLQTESPIVQKINIQDHLLGRNEEQQEKKNQSRLLWKVSVFIWMAITLIYMYIYAQTWRKPWDTHSSD